MIHIRRWAANSQGVELRLEELPNRSEIAANECIWIDLSNPTPEEEAEVFEKFFAIHPLTLEDIAKHRRTPTEGAHLPKAEEFSDYLFVVVNPLPSWLHKRIAESQSNGHEDALPPPHLSRLSRPQLSAVLTHQLLITHHYDALSCVDSIHTYTHKHPDCGTRGPDYLFHLILDQMVDEYAPVVERIAEQLDRMETRLFTDPTPDLLHKLLRLKRRVAFMRKTLVLEREVLARLQRGEFELVDEREMAYYRNVYDHLVRYTELIESAREMVSDLMETHLSAMSNRLNQVMKFLTMISTVLLPMTFIAGVYGMNFENMPELKWKYGYYFSLVLMFTIAVGSITLFRWRRWL